MRHGGDLFRGGGTRDRLWRDRLYTAPGGLFKVGAWPKSGEAREETQERFARIGYQAGIIEFLKVSVMNLLTSSEW